MDVAVEVERQGYAIFKGQVRFEVKFLNLAMSKLLFFSTDTGLEGKEVPVSLSKDICDCTWVLFLVI